MNNYSFLDSSKTDYEIDQSKSNASHIQENEYSNTHSLKSQVTSQLSLFNGPEPPKLQIISNSEINIISPVKSEKIIKLEFQFLDLYSNQQYDKAINKLEKLLFYEPKSMIYHDMIAKTYLKLHDISSAKSYYKKCLHLQGHLKNSSLSKTIENIILAKGLIKLINSHKLNHSKSVNLNKIKQNQDSTNFHYLKALSFLSVGKRDSALQEIENLLITNPKHVESYILLAKICLNSGKLEESNSNYWKAYNLDPNNEEVKEFLPIIKLHVDNYLKKANESIMKGNVEMGYLWCTKALKLYPNNPEVLLIRSAIYRNLNNFKDSMNDLNTAEKILCEKHGKNRLEYIQNSYNNQLHKSYSIMGIDNLKRNKYRTSIILFDKAIEIKKDDATSHFYKGDCLLKTNKFTEAFEEFSICLKINPNNKLAQHKCGLIKWKSAIELYNKREYSKCIEAINNAISFSSNVSEYFLLRAKCFLKLKKINKTLEDLKYSLQLNPNNLEAIQIKKYLTR